MQDEKLEHDLKILKEVAEGKPKENEIDILKVRETLREKGAIPLNGKHKLSAFRCKCGERVITIEDKQKTPPCPNCGRQYVGIENKDGDIIPVEVLKENGRILDD